MSRPAVFLARREDFLTLARKGRRRAGVFWLLRYFPRRGGGCARFGVSVSKRHLRPASRRNRMRRVLREAFRQRWAGELPACDFFLASSAKFKKADEESLRAECLRLLNEAGAAVVAGGRRRRR